MNNYENLYPRQRIKSFRHYLMHLMRVFLLLVTIGLSSVFANSTEAQTKIDINVKNISLEELFTQIQNKSEYIFFYKDDVLNYKVSMNVKKATLQLPIISPVQKQRNLVQTIRLKIGLLIVFVLHQLLF